MNLAGLPTEARNPRSSSLDSMSTAEILRLMNDEDQTVAEAVRDCLGAIEQAVDRAAVSLGQGGRLVYAGAGTSGRLGLLDAVECPPTFSTDPTQVVALLAGGDSAFVQAVEGAEDDPTRGAAAVDQLDVGPLDTVVGLAASGRTPYVVGALVRARERGASTVSVACNPESRIGTEADVAIEVVTGPEVLTGSTRLKAGTAQKMVCNMISTTAMVRIGKVYGNLMVDLHPTNAKLVDRSHRIVADATGVDLATATTALRAAGGNSKVAIVMLLAGADAQDAAALLDRSHGRVTGAVTEPTP